MKPRVISYIRFSSQRQSRGRSEDRQEEAALKWCEEKGLSLDENIQDLGVSAFTGKHRKKGNLRAFLDQVEAGKVPPGSTLLVEHFDRLTREEIDDADVLVKSILRKDVSIVTLLDGATYTKKSLNNIAALIAMILAFGQSHSESFKKGGRVSDTFKAKRSEGKRVFGSAPGWLKRRAGGKDGEWETIPHLAEVVVRVFELAAAGVGGPSIARLANSEKWPVPTRVTKQSTAHWHSKMPAILLKNRAVLGESQHIIRGRNALMSLESDVPVPAGPAVPDYYPRIVSDELWHLARGAIETRKTAAPKRDQNYFNVFSGLMRCGHCGAPVQRKIEHRGWSRAQLICTSKMAGLTACKTASALKTEAPVLHDICAYAGAYMGLGYDKQAAQEEIVIAEAKLKEVALSLKNVVALGRAAGPVPEVLADIAQLTKQREGLENLIEEQKNTLAVDPNSLFDTRYAQDVIKVLYEVSDSALLQRADCNARLRRAVEVIWIWAYDMAMVQFKHSRAKPTRDPEEDAKMDAKTMAARAAKEEAKKNAKVRLIVLLEPKKAVPANPKRPNANRPAYEASLAGTLKVPVFPR